MEPNEALTVGELKALFEYHASVLNNRLVMNGRRVHSSRRITAIGHLLDEYKARHGQ